MSIFKSCKDCICYSCLYYWSARCPHGLCYDDYRAKYKPHPADPSRKAWSNWDLPGEQQHWCRGGALFPADPGDCEKYVEYEGQRIEECLKANVAVFQDGFISCSLIENFGCERCYEEWEKKNE